MQESTNLDLQKKAA